ncbi:hypothetical protein JYP52_23600 [Nitratireductor aquibiodomus]|uniref:hypothetical protein n=1 Tax=Nitratireductor aquibiodomus TaxID=204799 RepID=UPI0019D3D42B|nr:hypothetical protein [Nitratireductor aquibiodomus]MBN7764118.1 hypothetical protein [Nitratireductor aquibiodomus]
MSELPTNWQQAFQSFTTSTAFAMQLSHAQVRALDAIKNDTWQGSDYHMFYASARALQRRGLVEFNRPVKGESRSWIYRLTPAGELVLDLIFLAGAVPQSDEAAP